jgi:hypothetical protein
MTISFFRLFLVGRHRVWHLQTALPKTNFYGGRQPVPNDGGIERVRLSIKWWPANLPEIELRRNRLSLPHSGGQHMLLFHAESRSATAYTLEVLRSVPAHDEDCLAGAESSD